MPGQTRPLLEVLREAGPDWSDQQLANVGSKLGQIGIDTSQALAEALAAPGQLNAWLSEAGLKTFKNETVRQLKRALGVRRGSRSVRAAAAGEPRDPCGGSPPASAGATYRQSFIGEEEHKAEGWTRGEDCPPDGADPGQESFGSLSGILAGLDAEEATDEQLLREECRARGIPEDQLRQAGPAGLHRVLDGVRRLEASSFPSLWRQCRELGFCPQTPEKGDSSKLKHERKELIQCLKDSLVWKHMEPHGLYQIVKERGLPASGCESRAELVQILSVSNMKLMERCKERGIPGWRIGDFGLAEELCRQVDRLWAMPKDALEAEGRKLGVPLDPGMQQPELVGRLRSVLIWQCLPLGELEEECQELGLPTSRSSGQQQEQCEALVERLLQHSCTQTWEKQGIPARRLGFEAAARVVGMIADLSSQSVADLREQYEEMACGLRPEKSWGRGELARRVSKFVIWEALPLPELQKDCVRIGMPLDALIAQDDAETQRLLMIQVLIIQPIMDSWKTRGFPLQRVECFDSIVELVNRHSQIEDMAGAELGEEYRMLRLAAPRDMKDTDMQRHLKLAAFWEALSWDELVVECSARHIAAGGCDEEDAEKSADQKGRAVRLLLVHECLCEWELKGFPAHRIGDLDEVVLMATRYDALRKLQDADIRTAYADIGLPEERGMDRQDMLAAMKRALVWQALPVEELRKECGGRAPAGTTRSREALIDWLLTDMAEHAYSLKGVPAKRLGSLRAAADLARRLDALEAMGRERLAREHAALGPALLDMVMLDANAKYNILGSTMKKHMEDADMREQLKLAALWEALPRSELAKDCAERRIAVHDKGPPSCDEGDQKRHLVSQLFAHECARAWESKGFPARRIGKLDEVILMVARYDEFQGLQEADLRSAYADMGLPEEEGAGRGEMLATLKRALVWQALPAEELQRECGGRAPGGPGSDREALIDWLLMDLTEPAYNARGIPVKRMGSVQLAAKVAKDMGRFDSMSKEQLVKEYGLCHAMLDLGAGDLTEEYGGLGLAMLRAEGALERAELLGRLKTFVLWKAMPLSELNKECARIGMPMNAGAEDSAGTQRSLMVHVLVTHLLMDAWRARGFSLLRIEHLESRVELVSRHGQVEGMAAPELAEGCRALGLAVRGGTPDADLRKHLKLVAFWQAVSWNELLRECAARRIHVGGNVSTFGEEPRKHLVGKLLDHERLNEWEHRGFPAHRIGKLDEVVWMAEKYSEFEGMRDDDLRNVCADIGLPDEEDMGREERLATMRLVLTWQALPLHELRKESKGGGHEGMGSSKEALMNWLLMDLTVKRLGSLQAATNLAALFQTYELLGKSQIAKRYTALGHVLLDMITMDLVQNPHVLGSVLQNDTKDADMWKRLKQAAFWHGLSWDDLIVACADRDIRADPTRPPRESRHKRHLVSQLLVHECLCDWEARGFPAHRIGTLDGVISMAVKYEGLQSMQVADLRRAYADVGLPEEEGMERRELLRRLKLVLTWQALPLEELQRECRGKAREEMTDDRDTLMGWLFMDLAEHVYNQRGVPVKQLGSLQAAADLARQFDVLESMGGEELAKEYTPLVHALLDVISLDLSEEFSKLELTIQKDMDESDMRRQLKLSRLWRALPCDELHVECIVRHIAIGDHFFSARGDQDQQKDDLVKRLFAHECLCAWEAKGFPAHRIGKLDEVVLMAAKYRAAQSMQDLDLRTAYADIGLPEERGMDRQGMLERLRLALTWQALPLEELARECKDGPPEEMANDKEALINWLLVGLAEPTYSSRGIPVKRLGSTRAAAHLAKRFDGLESMGVEQLAEEYTALGLPADPDLSKDELLQRIKTVLVWCALPTEELQRECNARGLSQAGGASPHKDEELRGLLRDLLLLSMCADVFVRAGVPARRFSSIQAAHRAVKQLEHLKLMDARALRIEYSTLCMPIMRGLSQETLRPRLRAMIVWEACTMDELRKECEARQLLQPGAQLGDNSLELSTYFLDLLRFDECGDTFKNNKVLMARWKILRATTFTDTACECFDALDLTELTDAYEMLSVPILSDLPPGRWVGCLNAVILWGGLAVDELRAECEVRGIAHSGIRRSIGAERQSRQLLDLLLFWQCEEAFKGSGIPVNRLQSFAACTGLAKQWQEIGAMDGAELVAKCGDMGINPATLTKDEIVDRLKQASFWMEAPIKEVQEICRRSRVNSIAKEGEKSVLVGRLVQALWAQPPRQPKFTPTEPQPGPVGASELKALKAKYGGGGLTPPAEAEAWDTREVLLFLHSKGFFNPSEMAAKRRRPPASTDCANDPTAARMSVVVPTLESRQHFHQQLWATFDKQEWADRELIVIESYTTRPSPFFTDKAREDDRIVYVPYQIKGGADLSIGTKRNMGIHLASGAYIANFDDDDLYAPTYLTTMVEEMRRQECDAITLSCWYMYECSTGKFGQVDPKQVCSGEPEMIDDWIYGYGFSNVHTRDIALQVPYGNVNMGEDWQFLTMIRRRHLRGKGQVYGRLEFLDQAGVALFYDNYGICVHTMHTKNTSEIWAHRKVPQSEVEVLEVTALGDTFRQHMQRFPSRTRYSNFIQCREQVRYQELAVRHAAGHLKLTCLVGSTGEEIKRQIRNARGDLGDSRIKLYRSFPPPGEPEPKETLLGDSLLGDDERVGVRASELWATFGEDASSAA